MMFGGGVWPMRTVVGAGWIMTGVGDGETTIGAWGAARYTGVNGGGAGVSGGAEGGTTACGVP
jgi:hypothetical protein